MLTTREGDYRKEESERASERNEQREMNEES